MSEPRLLYTLLGLNRAGRFLYLGLIVVAVIGGGVWTIALPRWRFSDLDEQLFKAARHGDVAGITRAIDAGARVDAQAPVDHKTALFRAAVFGHASAVKTLLARGANLEARGSDGHTALEVVTAARADEKDPVKGGALDTVIVILQNSTGER